MSFPSSDLGNGIVVYIASEHYLNADLVILKEGYFATRQDLWDLRKLKKLEKKLPKCEIHFPEM